MPRRLWTTSLALLVLCGLDHSLSYATFFDIGSLFGSGSHSSSTTASVELKVSDKDGPISVEYDDIGTYNGLPTIKIKEKLREPAGGEIDIWSDVEVEVCIDTDSHGNPLGDIFDNIEDIFDHIFGLLNHKKKSSSSSYGYGHHDDEEEEEEDPWENGIDIGVKKYVKNKTEVLYPTYRMVLGTGVGDDFVASDPNDGLYFLTSPAPTETTNYFSDPPGSDDPFSDYLEWNSDGDTSPGLGENDEAAFRFGVHVPRELFVAEDGCCDGFTARFTIRQHAEIPPIVPEPAALVLASLGLVTVASRRRRPQ